MTDALWLSLGGALAGGFGLGALHFHLLWWTTRGLHATPRPFLRLALSSAVRLGGLLAGLALLTGLQSAPLLAALVGVAAGRAAVVRWVSLVTRSARGRTREAAP